MLGLKLVVLSSVIENDIKTSNINNNLCEYNIHITVIFPLL